MVDLAPGSSVDVENPHIDIETSAPGFINDILVKEGPPGPPGADGADGVIQTVNGKTGTSITLTAADVSAVPTIRTVNAGTGLTGGGALSADRTLAVAYGTTGTTAAAGNDSRITGAAQKASNLSDLASASTARTNLGLGTAATKNTGTGAGQIPILSATPGTPDGTKYLRDDGTWSTPSGGSTSSVARVLKAASTSRASTTTLAADPELTYTIPSAGTYRITGWLQWTSTSATPGVSWSVLRGAGAPHPVGQARHTTTAAAITGGVLPGTQASAITTSSVGAISTFEVLGAQASGDVIAVNWAQTTSSAAAVVLNANSYIEIEKVG